MVAIEELKKVVLFEELTDQMLEKLCPLVETELFEERQMIYEPNTAANQLYSLKRGKVLLEAELSSALIISLGAIKPGYSFGWSSLIPPASHTSYAVSAEQSEIFAVPGDKLLNLLNEDHGMGHAIMHKVVRILENRLERRTAQFLRVMTKHPEIATLLGL